MAVYVKYGKIEGDATQDNHDKWIPVHSVQFGCGRAISTPVGAAKGREASEPSISEITITKELDGSSHELFKASTEGKAGEELTVDFCATASGGQAYLTFVCTEALISGYSLSSGGDKPSESISFNFTKIEFKNAPLDDENEPTGPFTVVYDLRKAKTG